MTLPFEQMIHEVRRRARLATALAAIEASRATLHTLLECLPAGAASDLAATLPGTLGEGYERREGWQTGESLTWEEFVARVAEREGNIPPLEAASHARIVTQTLVDSMSLVLPDATQEEVIRSLLALLPPEIAASLLAMDAEPHMHQSMLA